MTRIFRTFQDKFENKKWNGGGGWPKPCDADADGDRVVLAEEDGKEGTDGVGGGFLRHLRGWAMVA